MPYYSLSTKTLNLSSLLNLFTHCSSLNSLLSTQSLHAHLYRTGLTNHTLLSNRLIHLYSKLNSVSSSVKTFNELPFKNTHSYNIILCSFANSGRFKDAQNLFDVMPERDTVSFNTMISMYISRGDVNKAFNYVNQMRVVGIRVSEFTLSIVASSVFSQIHAKELHGVAIRNGYNYSNNVVSNSIISMYGKVGLVNYAYFTFRELKNRDLVSLNSILLVYKESGLKDRFFECFKLMCYNGFQIDGYTVSTILSFCTDIKDLNKGEQIITITIKLGFNSNSIVSSTIIDLYCNCGKLANANRVFKDMKKLDPFICDSMIMGFIRFGLREKAIKLFLLSLRMNIKLTEFMLANILNLSSGFGSREWGIQIHCLVLKLGFEKDPIVSNALLDVYSKMGLIDCAIKIFRGAYMKDLVLFNTIIMGLAKNGRGKEALKLFDEMLKRENIKPDRITILGILLACKIDGLINESREIFTSMESKFRVSRGFDHYICMIELMGQTGRFKEVIDLINQMPYKINSTFLGTLLDLSLNQGEINCAEKLAEEMVQLESKDFLPYSILAQLYGIRGKWERVARIWKFAKERGVKREEDFSSVCIKNLYEFNFDEILHFGGKDLYRMVELLDWEVEIEMYEIE